jgi:hypothetical protein
MANIFQQALAMSLAQVTDSLAEVSMFLVRVTDCLFRPTKSLVEATKSLLCLSKCMAGLSMGRKQTTAPPNKKLCNLVTALNDLLNPLEIL